MFHHITGQGCIHHRPFIYHHSTPVCLEPAVVRAIPINIMDLWVDVFLSTLGVAVIYMLICAFFSPFILLLFFSQCRREPYATYKSELGVCEA